MGKYSFWSDKSLEPKRQYRFLMYIGGIPQWLIKTTDKPSFTISETTHKYLNHNFFFPGRVEWNTINLKLVDPVAPDASKTMMDIIKSSGYHFPVSPDDTSTVSKKRAIEALGRVVIEQIGPEGGEAIERWSLHNAWVKDVKFGNLDYEGDDMVEVEIELRFDWAELELAGDPVPTAEK